MADKTSPGQRPTHEDEKMTDVVFEITTNLKRGVARVYCVKTDTGFRVVREACSFRTPTKSHSASTEAAARYIAGAFCK